MVTQSPLGPTVADPLQEPGEISLDEIRGGKTQVGGPMKYITLLNLLRCGNGRWQEMGLALATLPEADTSSIKPSLQG